MSSSASYPLPDRQRRLSSASASAPPLERAHSYHAPSQALSKTDIDSQLHAQSQSLPTLPRPDSRPSYPGPSLDTAKLTGHNHHQHHHRHSHHHNHLNNHHTYHYRHFSASSSSVPPPAHGSDRDGAHLATDRRSLMDPGPSSPRLAPTLCSAQSVPGGSAASAPTRIRLCNLSHIQTLASEEVRRDGGGGDSLSAGSGGDRDRSVSPLDVPRQYDISSMPVSDIIEMIASLLNKITATNDAQHGVLHRHASSNGHRTTAGSTTQHPQSSSVLAFHGKNVPSISILNYLARIHKYCPTTYEVFLSLLVYFDRITAMVNEPFAASLRHRAEAGEAGSPSSPSLPTPPSSQDSPPSPRIDHDDAVGLSQCFVVDSYNIHRLIIAGVTCASKFFSDVFYTNSRYAKVGGLPLPELNHLELQFLVLNDFRLAIPVEELEAYATMLVEFYVREVVHQQMLQRQERQERLLLQQRQKIWFEHEREHERQQERERQRLKEHDWQWLQRQSEKEREKEREREINDAGKDSCPISRMDVDPPAVSTPGPS